MSDINLGVGDAADAFIAILGPPEPPEADSFSSGLIITVGDATLEPPPPEADCFSDMNLVVGVVADALDNRRCCMVICQMPPAPPEPPPTAGRFLADIVCTASVRASGFSTMLGGGCTGFVLCAAGQDLECNT